MKLSVKYPLYFQRSSIYFSTAIRILLNLVLIIVIVALVVSVGKSAYDLWQNLSKPLEVVLQQMLLDVVFIVALIEVANTIIGYLKDGTVHVRYIVDTVLIIMLNEVVSAWFSHAPFETFASLALIIGVLAAVRLSVTRFAPLPVSED